MLVKVTSWRPFQCPKYQPFLLLEGYWNHMEDILGCFLISFLNCFVSPHSVLTDAFLLRTFHFWTFDNPSLGKYFIAYMTFLSLCYQIQFRGRPEISADQREKYLQRYHQVQQQQGNLLNVSNIAGINQKQFPTQQPNPLLQQVLPSVTTILKFDALCQAI